MDLWIESDWPDHSQPNFGETGLDFVEHYKEFQRPDRIILAVDDSTPSPMKEATRLTCYLPIIIVLAADLCVGIRFSARISESSITDIANQQQLATAVFALGSFWRSEAVFGCLDGVVRTTVGYAGGSKTNPEYRSLGDHAESVQVTSYVPSFFSLLICILLPV